METAINKFGNKDVRWSSQGMIRLSLEGMKRLFEPTVERIKQAVHDVVVNVPGRFRFRFRFQSEAKSQGRQTRGFWLGGNWSE